MKDGWGLDVNRPDHALDEELGWTADEDADDWGPAQIHVATPVTRAFFAVTLTAAGLSWLRFQLIRTGIYRRRHL